MTSTSQNSRRKSQVNTIAKRFAAALLGLTAIVVSGPQVVIAQQETTPVELSDTRNYRFCEILVINDGFVDIYNTSGLNQCPDDAWTALDPAATAKEMGVDAIQKNGPHFWVMDAQTISFGETKSFNGIDARWGARAPLSSLGGSEGSTPYKPFKTCKTQKMIYETDKDIYEMLDTDGNVWVLQAHDTQFPMESLGDLEAQMKLLPEGWSYRSRTLDQPLILDLKATECNMGIGDEFHQYYTLEPNNS